jgi:DnaJ-class molecular chaperone
MSEDQIKIFIESDMTWHRPTQSFGSPDNFFNVLWNNALNEKDKINSMYQKMRFKTNNTLSSKDVKAFKIMGLKVNSNWPIIQKKFKTLVKKFHPDMNSGSRLYEEKLKQITLAYNHLKLAMRENKQ